MRSLWSLITRNNLTPNQFFILWCVAEGIMPRGLDPSIDIRILLGMRLLVRDGDTYVPTKDGAKLIAEVEDVYSNAEPKAVLDDMDGKVQEYLELWPKIKLPSNKYARSDKNNIKKNFAWFFKNYDYDWETVMKATEMYVDEYQRDNYKFMRTSQYFIGKTTDGRSKESDLANYCAKILSGDTEDDTPNFPDHVF